MLKWPQLKNHDAVTSGPHYESPVKYHDVLNSPGQWIGNQKAGKGYSNDLDPHLYLHDNVETDVVVKDAKLYRIE